MRMKRAYLNEEKIFNERRMTFQLRKAVFVERREGEYESKEKEQHKYDA